MILILWVEWVKWNKNRLALDDGSVYCKRNVWELQNRTKMETVRMEKKGEMWETFIRKKTETELCKMIKVKGKPKYDYGF